MPKYRRLQKIGTGSYGAVYQGRNLKDGKFVAMKKIVSNSDECGFPSAYLREISLLKMLRHKNIIELKDVLWHDDERIFLIFEHMMNDLKTYMDQFEPHGLRSQALRCYFHQIVVGLEYCHSHGVMHRDLKPENLLIDSTGNIKIADFGLGRSISIPFRQYTSNVATLWYRAPELLLGMSRYSYALDIWSLGCILFEMATGEALFCGDSEINQVRCIFKTLGDPTEDIWPGVTTLPYYNDGFPNDDAKSKKLDALTSIVYLVIETMLVYDPNKRISAKKLLNHPYFYNISSTKTVIPLSGINLTGEIFEVAV